VNHADLAVFCAGLLAWALAVNPTSHNEGAMEQQGRRTFLRNALFTGAVAAASGLPVARAFAAPIAEPNGLTPGLMQRALAAFQRHGAQIVERRMMAIVDFSVASATPRFHLLNREDGTSKAMLVAHGSGSDPEHSGFVQNFSNIPRSNASSQGAYLTGQHYIGQHGLSRRMSGLDPDNDQAEARAIVIHPAWYVSEAMALEKGKIGRSQGCFAFSDVDIDQVLWRLPAGSFIYADKI
jgi:L,D-transpeptidase catalytic domain